MTENPENFEQVLIIDKKDFENNFSVWLDRITIERILLDKSKIINITLEGGEVIKVPADQILRQQ